MCERERERIEGLHSKNRLLGQIVQKALRPSAQKEIITHNTDLFAFGCLDARSCGRMDKHTGGGRFNTLVLRDFSV